MPLRLLSFFIARPTGLLPRRGAASPWHPISHKDIMAIARILTFSGDAAGAINTIDAYMQLDPLYRDITLYFLAEARVSLGQFDAAVTALKQRLERNPNSETSYALLASCYGHLGRIAESRAAWAEVMRIAPNFSIERQRRILPFKNPDDFERRVEGMRKAGLPYSARCERMGQRP